MTCRLALVLFFYIMLSQIGHTQSNLALGQWIDHLPYQKGTSVTQSDTKIFYSTSLSLVTIDKEDGTVDFISKTDGLSDVGISRVRYDQITDQLFIIYENGNLDIVSSSEIINIPNIQSNTSISGNKSINDIDFVSASEALLATDFGIVIFDPTTYIFGATVITGVRVNDIAHIDSRYFAATTEGVYTLDASRANNVANFDEWEFLGREVGLPDIYNAQSIGSHNQRVYIGTDQVLYKSDSSFDEWSAIFQSRELQLSYIAPSDGRLIVGWVGADGTASEVLFFDEDDESVSAGSQCSGIPLDAIRDEDGGIWYADDFLRFRRSQDYTQSCVQTSYNSPFSENISDIVIQDGGVLVASGGVAENFTYLFSRDGFYRFDQSEWQNFNEFDIQNFGDFDLLSVFRVAFHPSQSTLYAGSYWGGLLEVDQETGAMTLFDQTNSSIQGTIGDERRERITGLAFDEEENLWISTYDAPQPINVRTPDGAWMAFNVPSLGTLTDIIVDRDGFKWCPIDGGQGGILVYDSGASIQSRADDRFRWITSGTSELPTSKVLSVEVDLDGSVWVGTDQGPVIFDCGSDVFDNNRCRGDRITVTQDSILSILLGDQQVNVIAIDGANQKWLGTRSGLFVQSAQGDEQIAHFTTDNSPLLDDVITALAYDGDLGQMWVGTDKGLMTLQTNTTEGAPFHNAPDIFAFPNPVTPDYTGPIAIRGLVRDANVKITDVNGRLQRC